MNKEKMRYNERSNKEISLRGRTVLYAYLVAVVVYLGVTFLLPVDMQNAARYNLSATSLRLLSATVVVPLMLIWGAAFYGYAKLRRYSDTIKSSAEGQAVATTANGVMVLAVGLPITSIINKLLKFIGQSHTNLATGFTISTNYVSLLFPLIAFFLISVGVGRLTKLKNKRLPRRGVHSILILFSFISVGYVSLLVHFAFSAVQGAGSVYKMPLWLVLTTLAVPYIYTWFVGIMAAYEMLVYNATLKGVIYRKSWSLVSVGLGLIITSQIVVQCTTSLSRQLSQLHIASLISIVYGLLFLMAAGYIVLAYGIRKLQRIEEV